MSNPWGAPDLEPRMEEREFSAPLASPGARFGAVFVDNLLVIIVAAPGIWWYANDPMGHHPAGDLSLPFALFSFAAVFLVYLIQWYAKATYGQTLGKYLLGIRRAQRPTAGVRGRDRDALVGSRDARRDPDRGPAVRAGRRYVFSAGNLCLHDRPAGTVVVVV